MIISSGDVRSVRAALTGVPLACLVIASTAAASMSAKRAPIPVTFVGDFVSAAISYVTTAQKQFKRGLAVRLDVKVCRRLVQPGCGFQGSTPTTALQVVQSYGHSLRQALIVKVDYNEDWRGYSDGINRVMRAALADSRLASGR
jgi:hypothetical protein